MRIGSVNKVQPETHHLYCEGRAVDPNRHVGFSSICRGVVCGVIRGSKLSCGDDEGAMTDQAILLHQMVVL